MGDEMIDGADNIAEVDVEQKARDKVAKEIGEIRRRRSKTQKKRFLTNKEDYVSKRADSNDYLNMAKFAISAMMFNHVVSAMDAVWSTKNRNRPSKPKEVKTDFGLLYDKHSKYGIGGISLSLYW